MTRLSCDKCGFTTSTESGLHHHLERHENPDFEPKGCPFTGCNFVSHSFAEISKHQDEMHFNHKCYKLSSLDRVFRKHVASKPGRHRCLLCNKVWKNRKPAEVHVSKNHEQEIGFPPEVKCFYCAFKGKHSSDLKKHVKVSKTESLAKMTWSYVYSLFFLRTCILTSPTNTANLTFSCA